MVRAPEPIWIDRHLRVLCSLDAKEFGKRQSRRESLSQPTTEIDFSKEPKLLDLDNPHTRHAQRDLRRPRAPAPPFRVFRVFRGSSPSPSRPSRLRGDPFPEFVVRFEPAPGIFH